MVLGVLAGSKMAMQDLGIELTRQRRGRSHVVFAATIMIQGQDPDGKRSVSPLRPEGVVHP